MSQAASAREGAGPHAGMSFPEFVVMIAALMALNALAMDVMLPALPDIGSALNIVNENDRQDVLISYLIGFGGAQLFFGPISDAFGRKTVLLGGLGLYAAASVASLFSVTLDQLLLARLVQGIGCAATRVIAVSIVRDCYTGRQMGRVMSLAMMIFMAVPIIAPSIGQVILIVSNWHWIFSMLLIAGLAMFAWCATRLPETLAVSDRRPLNMKAIGSAYLKTVKTRVTLGYTLATACVFGALFAFLAMSQQVFVGIFGLGVWFPVAFAAIALAMTGASFTNSRLVEHMGMRPLSHAAVITFTAVGFLFLILSLLGIMNVYLFAVLAAILTACFGFIGPNFNAMAMEPLGDIAGTASSVIGFTTTLGGAMLGYLAGKFFDGTTVPLASTYAFYGLGAILCILFAEGGRMFRTLER